MRRLAVFLSGSGSNAENIIKHFEGNDDIKVVLVLSDKSEAYGLQRAKSFCIPTVAFQRQEFLKSDKILNILRNEEVDFIVLAGFLCYVPQNIISYYAGKIVNIHPSLLPKYGGKGMYGAKVHQAVVDGGESESGITIHHINEKFDDGEVIFQAKCEVLSNDTPEKVEAKVRALEILHFPAVIEAEINK